MHTPTVKTAYSPVFGPVPIGVKTPYRSLGVAPPPGPHIEAMERNAVRSMQSRRTPHKDALARWLDDKGQYAIWMDYARQYRAHSGFTRGWVGTGLMLAAMGASALVTHFAKDHYGRSRPYQVDGSIQLLVKDQGSNKSYPSGHATSAAAGATVMSYLWPLRSAEFVHMANQVARSRVYSGVHYPSDVIAGQRVGRTVGSWFGRFIR